MYGQQGNSQGGSRSERLSSDADTERCNSPALSSSAAVLHITGTRKNRAMSNPVRQTRASMLRAEANKKLTESKARATSDAKRRASKPLDRDLRPGGCGEGSSALAVPSTRHTLPNGFEVGDPFTENTPTKIPPVSKRFRSDLVAATASLDHEVSPSVSSNRNRVTTTTITATTSNKNRHSSFDPCWRRHGSPSENTQISITSSLLTTPGKYALISRVDTVNAQLLREMSGGSRYSSYCPPTGQEEYVARYGNATIATAVARAQMVDCGKPLPSPESPKAQEGSAPSRRTSLSDGSVVLDPSDHLPPKRLAAQAAGSRRSAGRPEIGDQIDNTHAKRVRPAPAANASRIHTGKAPMTLSEQQRKILGRDAGIEATAIRPDIYTRLAVHPPLRPAGPSGIGTGAAVRLQRSRDTSATIPAAGAAAARGGEAPAPIQRLPIKKAASTARPPRRSPTVESPCKTRPSLHPPAKKPVPLGFKSNNPRANQARDPERKSPVQQAPALVEKPQAVKASPNGAEHKAHRQQQKTQGPRAPGAAGPSPEQLFALENPTGIPMPPLPPAPLADITRLGVAKNPRPSLGRRWLSRKTPSKVVGAITTTTPTFGDQKENVPPSSHLAPDPALPDAQSGGRSKKHLGLKNIFHKSPRDSHGSRFSGRGFLGLGGAPDGGPATQTAPDATPKPFGFSKDEVNQLKSQLRSHCPAVDGGMNTVIGRYYTSPLPSYDQSPSRDVRNGNPIGVAMELIHAASKERDRAQSERMFQLSEIMVDAVTKSHEASAASEVAKRASQEAELANVEVSLKLRQCVAWVQDWKRMAAKVMLAR